ncbi:MAG: PEP/pyruvate-binding domain-containing protein, partial [Candidatus Thiodiazotropha sp.]
MRVPALLHDWEAIHEAGPSSVGGKAWQLSRLERYGLPVPDALVIPAEAERIWLADHGAIDLSSVQASDSVAIASGELHRQLAAHPPPAFLEQALSLALSAKGWLDTPLAVRSSATAEDSKTASFAGIHLTQLNLVGPSVVLEGVREVWASRWLPQAFAYRQRFGIDPATDAMAVLIMPLLPAEASGIAFTCDPRSGRDDRLILHAHWGLGEALVGGEAVGDEILLEEDHLDDSLRLLSYVVGDKAVMRLPSPGGTQAVRTPTERADSRVLDDDQALKLGELVRSAATALDFSRPFYDLEWVWNGKRFWLVQARPVTAGARNTYPALQGQPDIWSRGNTCEVTPYPLSVYDWFAIRRMTNLMLERAQAVAGYPLRPGIQRSALFDGRLYLNLSIMQWELHDAFGFSPKMVNNLVGGHQPEITLPNSSLGQRIIRLLRLMRIMPPSKLILRKGERIVESTHDLAKALRNEPLAETEQALLTRLRELVRSVRSQKSLFFLQAASGGTLPLLVNILESRLPGEGHALVSALLTGGKPTITARQAYDLADLAKIARGDPITEKWLADPRRNNDWNDALPEDNAFRVAFSGFLERYGHRTVYETYIRHPRWREAPGYLFDTLQGLMELNLESLRERQRLAAEEATNRARHHLPFWLRPLLKGLIKGSIEETCHREAARSALISLIEPQRR